METNQLRETMARALSEMGFCRKNDNPFEFVDDNLGIHVIIGEDGDRVILCEKMSNIANYSAKTYESDMWALFETARVVERTHQTLSRIKTLSELHPQLQDLGELEDGWDGLGSRAFSLKALKWAHSILSLIEMKNKDIKFKVFPIVNDNFEICAYNPYKGARIHFFTRDTYLSVTDGRELHQFSKDCFAQAVLEFVREYEAK